MRIVLPVMVTIALASPALSQSGSGTINRRHVVGCRDSDVYDRIISMIYADNRDAATALIARMLGTGECIIWDEGQRVRIPIRLRPARAERSGFAAGADRGAQGNARQHLAEGKAWDAAQRTPGARLVFQHACKRGLGDCLEAAGIAISVGPLAGLAEVQESGWAGGEA